MAYTVPELVLVGTANNLVLGNIKPGQPNLDFSTNPQLYTDEAGDVESNW